MFDLQLVKIARSQTVHTTSVCGAKRDLKRLWEFLERIVETPPLKSLLQFHRLFALALLHDSLFVVTDAMTVRIPAQDVHIPETLRSANDGESIRIDRTSGRRALA